MKKVLLCLIIVFITLLIGCSKDSKVDVIKRIKKNWNVNLPTDMKEEYNYYSPTFTGRADQYAVFSYTDSSIEKLNSMFDFKQKDEDLTSELESFYNITNHSKSEIDKKYILDFTKNYTYYVLDKAVWLIINESDKTLTVYIKGY